MKRFAKLLALAMSLLVVLPSYSQPVEKTIKRKVAIGRFSNETQYAKGLFYDKDNDPMRKQASTFFLPSSPPAASSSFWRERTWMCSWPRRGRIWTR